jgi:hypothetical protein
LLSRKRGVANLHERNCAKNLVDNQALADHRKSFAIVNVQVGNLRSRQLKTVFSISLKFY